MLLGIDIRGLFSVIRKVFLIFFVKKDLIPVLKNQMKDLFNKEIKEIGKNHFIAIVGTPRCGNKNVLIEITKEKIGDIKVCFFSWNEISKKFLLLPICFKENTCLGVVMGEVPKGFFDHCNQFTEINKKLVRSVNVKGKPKLTVSGYNTALDELKQKLNYC